MDKPPPVALATLISWSWVIEDCPLCGRRHVHGAGAPGGDPRRLLGHRVAHCGGMGGYVLVAHTRELPSGG